MDPGKLNIHKSHGYELEIYKSLCDSFSRKQVAKEFPVSMCGRTIELKSLPKIQENRRCHDADVTPIVRDPLDDDSIPVESGAEITPVPREPSQSEKMQHELTHIPFQPWCTSCVKDKAQAEPHKPTERIIEDSELLVVQCDYLVLKNVAATGGLKVLSTYVRTFGYGMSTVVEMEGATDTFATVWAVKMLSCLGLSDIILQCEPEPSLIKWQKVSNPND